MYSQDFSVGESVTVQAPASSANLGPGFDCIGLALAITDEISATVVASGLTVTVEGCGAEQVPRDEGHLVWQSMCTMWDRLGVGRPPGLELHCRGAVPHSRGLGSSATAIVAGVGAALALSGWDLTSPEALALVGDVSGEMEGHPDNSSASVYGGLTLSWRDDGGSGWRTVHPPVHPDIEPVLLVPGATLATDTARKALPAQIPLRTAADTAARAALLMEAMTRDPSLLLPATREWLHQEVRRPAYAASMAVVDRLRSEGHAAVISGAGPSVLVLATSGTAGRITAPEGDWRVLRPGVAHAGLRVTSHKSARKV